MSLEDLQITEVESPRDEPLGSWRFGHGAGLGPVGPPSPPPACAVLGPRGEQESQAAVSIPGVEQRHKVH
jgi:hypothetical protein